MLGSSKNYFFVLMPNTQIAPTSSRKPATYIIDDWQLPTILRMTPPQRAAMICGRQMVPLNKPR